MEKKYEIYLYIIVTAIIAVCGILTIELSRLLLWMLETYIRVIFSLQTE